MDYQEQNGEQSEILTRYTNEIIKSFKTCEILKNHELAINSIDFSPDGLTILTSSEDNTISIFDVDQKKISRSLVNKTYGCNKAIFTHNSKAILCAGKNDYRIMYWCLHSNEILFSFLGHSDIITDLSMNPNSDLFLSTSSDRTSRLWDLCERKCVCIVQDSQCAAFDNNGNVIASVTSSINKANDTYENFINLYSIAENVEGIQKGPFDVFGVHTKNEIKQIKFSYDGNVIVCLTESELCIIDAFTGKSNGSVDLSEDVNRFDISPDSKYIALSCESGNINMYDIKGKFVVCLEFHTNSCGCIKFCKDYAMLASACSNLVLWIPSI